jgi:CYTH domain-containing protein
MAEYVYNATVKSLGLRTPIDARDGRYTAVFHLRSAAVGAEEFYTLENNTVRRETIAEAREKDTATLDAWTGHPHLRVIDNSTGFTEKLRRLEKEIYRTIGVPVPLEIERKYLVDFIDPDVIPVPYQTIDIEQFYIDSEEPGVEVRLRKRGQYGHYVYYRTEKRQVRKGVRIETERYVDEITYLRGLERKRSNSHIIVKKRLCFVYENRYFELDYMSKPKEQCYLEIELTEENEDPSLPPFLKGVVDITGDNTHSNFGIATRS